MKFVTNTHYKTMENNINLDAHSGLIIFDGSIVEINGQKVLLTLVKDADAPETKKIDLHTDSWAVLNDGSQRFKDTVVKWLKENKYTILTGEFYGHFYGVDISGKDNNWKGKDKFTHILTIDEFCALAYPEKEEGSELVGKWVRSTSDCTPSPIDKWFQVVGEDEKFISIKDLEQVYAWTKNQQPVRRQYDLANPLDYNPETLIGKYWNGNQIESIYFDDDEAMIPRFKLNNGLAVLCKIVTPSDVTDTPPVKSLKYEDCFERLKPKCYVDEALQIKQSVLVHNDNVPTERQAKQLAATIKLMTIMHDANGGEWVPKAGEMFYSFNYNREESKVVMSNYKTFIASPIYFRDHKTAKRAYEANKEIFHDYFGIGGENE